MNQPAYTTAATATGTGRNGRVTSEDGVLDHDVRMPRELGGPGGATNPEQLFAAAYATCFHGAMRMAARLRTLVLLGEVSVTATVSLLRDDTSFGLDVELTVEGAETDPDVLQQVVAEAHRLCPYSRALHGNVAVRIHTSTAPGHRKVR